MARTGAVLQPPPPVAIKVDLGLGADLDGVDAARFGPTLGSLSEEKAMPEHELIRGRIVDLRRHTNVHLYHRRPPGPSDRYELWLRDEAGHEFKFTIHTRTMPARRGHEVTVIKSVDDGRPTVVALINWTTLEAVNYAEIDRPPLLRR
jgi:hypothetical protein